MESKPEKEAKPFEGVDEQLKSNKVDPEESGGEGGGRGDRDGEYM